MKIKKASLRRLERKLNQMEHDGSNSYRISYIRNRIKELKRGINK